MDLLSKINSPEDIKKLSYKELEKLSTEIREFIIDNVSKTGGHLASNLGIVELTLALHKVFDSPKDKIVWDVGHQAYVHKILTGRKGKFGNLRMFGGLSGFPKYNESHHDIFNTGHSSTSISAALGIARARDIKDEDFKVLAVIGDGALTGGMAFEALNDLGHSKNDLIVILNDNEMSIAQNVGGLSRYLSKIRTQPIYYRVKNDVDSILNKIPAIGKTMAKTLEKAKGTIKYLIMPGAIFEDIGLTYLGPIDGHNIKDLEDVLNKAKGMKGPVLIHVMTKKGKGYKLAEENADKFHGIGKFNKETGEIPQKSGPDFSEAFGGFMIDLAKKNKNLVAITAAMPSGTGLDLFAKEFPKRFFDVGIAEQHAVTLAAGLATQGIKPVVAVYSTFLQRAYDQLIHDVALQKLSVVLAIDRAGLVGADGETHHGVFDLSYLGPIPNMIVMAPRNYFELHEMLKFSIKYNKGPIAIRYPRGVEEAIDIEDTSLQFGKAEVLSEGDDVVIIGVGKMAKTAYDVAARLSEAGISAGAVNARFIKPFDHEIIEESIENGKSVVIIEDNIRKGGFGNIVLDYLNEKEMNTQSVKIFAYPDEFITHGSVEELYKQYGLDADSIFNEIYSTVKARI